MREPPLPFYQIKRVFLACPGDLVSERSRFPRVIETVNNLRAHSLGFHLEPVGWERVIPSLGRPQDLINRELDLADLVVVLFWNRVGSPSRENSTKTGTMEEFESAMRAHNDLGRPLVWVYFRKPTAQPDDQLKGVLMFRKGLEEGKQLFFREYETLEDWEEMFRQHLVAFLDGLQRWNIDRNFDSMRPELALVKGNFLGEGIYRYGTKLRLWVDLDGDQNEEIVSFWFSVNALSLTVAKFDAGFGLEIPNPEDTSRIMHIAAKDVTNDGLPEILLARGDGLVNLSLAIWGFNEQGRKNRKLTPENFGLLAELGGQSRAYVSEGGTIIIPYGSQGFVTTYKWTGNAFESPEM